MPNLYNILPPPLQSTADGAYDWLTNDMGLPVSKVNIEKSIHDKVPLRPTFSAQSRDYHIICIEVLDSVYSSHLAQAVLQCMNLGLPVKLYVAVPAGTKDSEQMTKLKAAKAAGVGLLEVDTGGVTVIQNPLSLALSSVRAIDLSLFPKKYRENLIKADEVYRSGAPDKGCSLIYDELEALFRKVAEKTNQKGWWPNPSNLVVRTVSWSSLIDNWNTHLNRGQSNSVCPGFTSEFSARIKGITTHRNQSGHKPKSKEELIKRDRELRTRYEHALDLLLELVNLSKPLKI